MIVEKRFDPNRASEVESKFGLHPLVSKHLAGLNVSDEWIEGLLSANPQGSLPSPASLGNVVQAVERVRHHMNLRNTIYVYGDHDVDGLTSTAILVSTLKAVGAQVEYLIPHPNMHGRGLNPSVAKDLTNDLGQDLVITVDTGITDMEGVEVLTQHGVEVIITDHHLPEAHVPKCMIINPKVSGEPEFQNISGCGVSLFLSYAIYTASGIQNVDLLRSIFQLAAIGTIVDAVPIDNTNKMIVEKGLYYMRTNPAPFVATLFCDQAEIGKPLDYEAISFNLAPPVTAAGKSGRGDLVMELFTATDVDTAERCTHYLATIREKRKKLTEAIYKDAEAILAKHHNLEEDNVIFLANHDWDKSVLGVVGSKLVEKYNVPAILCGYGQSGFGGSARSPFGQNVHECFASMPEGYLSTFGGHKNSCGLSFKRENLERVRAFVFDYAKRKFTDYVEDTVVSAIVQPHQLTRDLVMEFNKVAPFCNVVPKPMFGIVNGHATIDRIMKDAHTKLILEDEHGGAVVALLFNQVLGQEGDTLTGVDLAGHVSINHYNGTETVQLILNTININQQP